MDVPTRPKGLLFDMDGTLTQPLLDFAAIRRDLGLPPDEAILEAMDAMTPPDREAADRVLDRHEHDAAERSTLAAGCHAILDYLREERLPFAVVTRNSRRALEIVWQKHCLPPCPTTTRDDAAYKPDPAPLRLAASRIGLEPADCWMVGDGEYDVLAAAAAGMVCVWISNGEARPFATKPDVTLATLNDLLSMLRS